MVVHDASWRLGRIQQEDIVVQPRLIVCRPSSTLICCLSSNYAYSSLRPGFGGNPVGL